MIATITFIVGMCAFTGLTAWILDGRDAASVYVTCSCGRVIRCLSVVDPIDAQRYAQLLSEGCPHCRKMWDRFSTGQSNPNPQSEPAHV